VHVDAGEQRDAAAAERAVERAFRVELDEEAAQRPNACAVPATMMEPSSRRCMASITCMPAPVSGTRSGNTNRPGMPGTLPNVSSALPSALRRAIVARMCGSNGLDGMNLLRSPATRILPSGRAGAAYGRNSRASTSSGVM
jgi:hypothetical protein